MKIIVPMAGRGSRLRPHTLTVPKPLVPVAGKPIVQHLVEDIAAVCGEKIEEIAFIIGDFGEQVERDLLEISTSLGAQGKICYQEEALGTAHAILCAKESLEGEVIVAFADTLFRADFSMNDVDSDGILWVSQIDDPSAFGVVKLDSDGVITDFVEKPQDFVSDLAMIGIYYFKDGKNLRNELQYLIDNNIIKGGEYQLPDALRNMTEKGLRFKPGKVDEWLDCGNKQATVDTNRRILEIKEKQLSRGNGVLLNNSIVIEPCFIGEGVEISSSVVGPHVSIGANTKIVDCSIKDSLIQSDSLIEGVVLSGAMIGNKVRYAVKPSDISLGDFTTIE